MEDIKDLKQKLGLGHGGALKGLDGEEGSGKMGKAKDIIAKAEQKEIELKGRVNYLQDQIEDFMAENKALRRLAGVPANYGIDRA